MVKNWSALTNQHIPSVTDINYISKKGIENNNTPSSVLHWSVTHLNICSAVHDVYIAYLHWVRSILAFSRMTGHATINNNVRKSKRQTKRSNGENSAMTHYPQPKIYIASPWLPKKMLRTITHCTCLFRWAHPIPFPITTPWKVKIIN